MKEGSLEIPFYVFHRKVPEDVFKPATKHMV